MKDIYARENPMVAEAVSAFEREIGATNVKVDVRISGDHPFLKFYVGRESPLYSHALLKIQKGLSPDSPFMGAIGLTLSPPKGGFPNTVEAGALLTLLTRSTREVAQGSVTQTFRVPYIPFHNREDNQLAQAASHVVRGRRGVGKSTLIRRAVEILESKNEIVSVIDMQTYSLLSGDELVAEVLSDVCRGFSEAGTTAEFDDLAQLAERVSTKKIGLNRVPPEIKRIIGKLTQRRSKNAFLFLDDFHLIEQRSQSRLLQYIHAALKGAGGWLKIAGLTSLLSVYSAKTREGLQIPGDAQFISLDLTLENPEAAESHLRAILAAFLNAVGYKLSQSIIPNAAFKRLVWATAGVPRDFLQMFARALEHAQRNRHSAVTISDVNISIGEFGQQKMDELNMDARNEADELRQLLEKIEQVCLIENKTNAFLIKSDESKARSLVRALSDLRMVHLIHQSITPDRAGERYEAYIIDYSVFTGFRRRRGVQEMVPTKGQFKASQLRALPKIEFTQNAA